MSSRMDKSIVERSRNGMLFSNDSENNLQLYRKGDSHNAEWKEPDTKEDWLWGSNYMKSSNYNACKTDLWG